MLSYHGDSHAIACLINLLHGKCQSASVDTSAISLIMNYLEKKSALFAGLSLKFIIQMDQPGEKKKLSQVEFLAFHFLSIAVCPGHQQEASPSILSPSLLPQVFVQIDQIPWSLPFFRLSNSPGPSHCPGSGLSRQHTGEPLSRLSPSLPRQCGARHPRGFVNFLSCSASKSTH